VRIAHWEIAVAAAATAFGWWIREPGLPWAVVASGMAAWVVVATVRARRAGALIVALAVVAGALVAVSATLRIRAVERRWSETRESLIQRASERLDETLAAAVDRARSLADAAVGIEAQSRAEAFAALQGLVTGGTPEHGVVLFDAAGRPWSWAGSHRLPPGPTTTELAARMTPFYVLLEARRQVGMRVAVAQVVLAAGGAVPDRDRTVADRFVRQTGVGLEFFAPGTAPFEPDVFDYCLPGCNPAPGEAAPDTLFSVRAEPASQGALKLELVAWGGRWVSLLAVATLVLLVGLGGVVGRWVGVVGLVGLFTLSPAGQHLGLDPLFSPAMYFLEGLGPLSASAGALGLTAAVLLLVLLQLVHRPLRLGRPGMVAAGVLVLAAPWAMWVVARGITPPATGLGMGLWLGWQLTLTLVGVVLGLTAALLLRGGGAAPRRGWVVWAVAAGAFALGVVGIMAWQPTGDWPLWYGLLWVPLALLAVQPARRTRLLATLAMVAGTGGALLTWGATVHGRLLLAERDAERLRGGDPVAIGLLDRFSVALGVEPAPLSAAALYARWQRGPLSEEDYPAVLATWSPRGQRIASLELAGLDLPEDYYRALADTALAAGEPVLRSLGTDPGVRYVSATPFPDGTVVTVGVAPRSQLIRPVLVGRFLRGERRLVAPYEMFLGEPPDEGPVPGPAAGWRRDGWQVRAMQAVEPVRGVRHLYVSVALRDPPQLLVRGALFVLLDAALLALLGLGAEALGQRLNVGTALLRRPRLRSYRSRLTLALAAFFVIPTLGFATWSIGRLRVEARRSRDLVIQQTLSDAAAAARHLVDARPGEIGVPLQELARRFGTDLLWYEGGALVEASAAVLVELGLVDAYLTPAVYRALTLEEEPEVTADAEIGGQLTRVGYQRLAGGLRAAPVLAAPRLVDVLGMRREQEDLAYGLLLVTLVGLGGAAGLAALAAHSLARPVQSLRAAAVAVGQGEAPAPFGQDVPAEFASVVQAFERMASDVDASQQALEAARRRTATVLRNIATGVVALDRTMLVTIANARAGELLAAPLEPGTPVAAATSAEWLPVWEWVLDFMRTGGELDTREFAIGQRRIRAQIAALQTDPKGCVVALDDTTELAHAMRVLAWGELARQIAHEIKNPLTPIRLGIQHLQRARRHGKADFDATLERTSQQILAEIERLDTIARAFSRFGAPPTEAAPPVAADLTALAEDVAALYSLSGEAEVSVEAEGAVSAMVRPDEVKEVLVNLVENARDAGASRVTLHVAAAAETAVLTVEDDGRGITGEHMIHIFEPQFSTTSSGTGLGLAICKRLVESWGGTIAVDSDPGRGTRVRIEVAGGELPID
jgi:signal transduction histidine kinase